MNVSVIVVNFHTTQLLPDLLTQCAGAPMVEEILVVHNDHSEALGEMDLDCRLLQLPVSRNLGFAGCVNLAVDQARSDWVLLVNPDVRLDARCIGELGHWAQRLNAAVVGPRFYWDDQRCYRLPPATGCSAGQDCATLLAGQHRLDAALVEQQWSMRHDRFWGATEPFVEPFLSGACLLVRRGAFAESAVLDERFFLYYEDTDLCARAVLADNPPICIPSAEAVHYWNQSPAEAETKAAHMRVSHDVFIRQHYGAVKWPEIDQSGVTPLPAMDEAQVPSRLWEEPSNWLEMSPHPLLVPFVQTSLSHGSRGVEWPVNRALWERLDAGWYYFRIRDRHGRILARWKREKSSPSRQVLIS